MSFVTTDEVTALVETDLETSDLQDLIDREEAELASLIGPLADERTEVFLLTTNLTTELIRLQRPTLEVEVTDNGVTVPEGDVRILSDHRTLLRLTADGSWARGYWVGPVEVTYEPSDAAQVKRVLIGLISIGLSESAAGGEMASETIGTYQYTRARSGTAALTTEQRRRALISTLLPRARPGSVRLRSSVEPHYALLGTMRPS